MNPETINAIRGYNRFDIELYSFVPRLFDEKAAAAGDDFTKDLNKFTKRNRVIGGLYFRQRVARLFNRISRSK